jgi:hypothetical protein
MLAAAGLIGILVGTVSGIRLTAGALIPVMLLALVVAASTALFGHATDASLGLVTFAVALQLGYVAAAAAHTALHRKQRNIAVHRDADEAELAAVRAQSR